MINVHLYCLLLRICPGFLVTCEMRIHTNHGVQRDLLLLIRVTVFVFLVGLGAVQNNVCLKTDGVLARFFHLQLDCIAFKICMQIAALYC